MKRFICENVFIPLRSGPSHKAEMVSQILFGESYAILDKSGSWYKAECLFDGCTGWIDMNHISTSIDESGSRGFVLNRPLSCIKSDNTRITLEPGSEIKEPDFGKKTFITGKNIFTVPGEFSIKYFEIDGTPADTAMKFINSPYIWGGRVPSGLDCSGLTQLVFKIHGVALPRNSSEQAMTGEQVGFLEETRAGDLVFFDNERGNITHVGMIISGGLVIHASGRVRIDTIDNNGIFNSERETYSHHLRMIRRISLPENH